MLTIGQLRAILDSIPPEFDKEKVLFPSGDHSFCQMGGVGLETVVDERSRISEWSGDSTDYGFKTIEGLNRSKTTKLIKALVIQL